MIPLVYGTLYIEQSNSQAESRMVVTRAGGEETVSYWLVGLEGQLERCELPGDEW